MSKPSDHEYGKGDFLPDLCAVNSVFFLILVGELLSFAFVVINRGVEQFSWLFFGTMSFLVQWVILASAAVICPLRSWFKTQNGIVAGSVSFSIVMIFTLAFSIVGAWLKFDVLHISTLINNLIVAAIFAGLVLRYFYLQQQLHNREQAELRSRIQAMQSRIRPHFLFNSMNSIASLIAIDPDAAEKMVVDLAELFRKSLSEPTLVTIEDEIRLCEKFVSIEKIRLGERLQVQWKIDLAGFKPSIPSLTMQPLIENAINHGIQPLTQGGLVEISVSYEAAKAGKESSPDAADGMVCIVIKNPVDRAARDAVGTRGNGMALQNIEHRLEAIYGPRAKIYCDEWDSSFSTVIRYPAFGEQKK